MLAENDDQPLVARVQQRLDLAVNLLRRERPANRVRVRPAKRAVLAIVRALAADVERGEQHDPVAVDVAFQLPRGLEDLLNQLGRVGPQQHGRLLQLQRLLVHALGDHVAHLGRVGLAIQ